MEKVIGSLGEFEAEASAFIPTQMPKTERATLITLSGELGAGKTAFVKAAAKALGITKEVTSPTFVLEKIYELPRKAEGFARLIHIDAYRLEGGAELAPLRFDETLQEADNLIMLEWPEKVTDALPAADTSISIETLPDGGRKITYA